MFVELLIFGVTFLVVYFVYCLKQVHQLFNSYGVKYLPGVPVFGNTIGNVLMKHHFFDDIDRIYKAFPEEKYVGYIEGTRPIIIIRDPEILKQVTVKDFDHFVDHAQFIADEFFDQTLFMLKGEKWRDMRVTLSPAFTGSKMKLMIPFMVEISHNVVKHLKNNQDKEFDVNDLIRRYTNDIIASTAFGLQVNSLENPDNEFYKTGQSVMNVTLKQRISMLISQTVSTKIGTYLPFFNDETTSFFKNLVKNTMEHREKNNIERPDMIHLLMEASKGKLKAQPNENDKAIGFATVQEMSWNAQSKTKREWTQDELAAQAFIFFFAAFESTASILVLAIHELMLNPEVKEKLYEEVKSFTQQQDNFTYDDIQNWKYLDNVLNETLRKWSPALVLDRMCVKNYELPATRKNAKPYKLKPGDIVYNAVNSIHMDERYYPDPEKFDPDRFSDENKNKIQPFTFMPFGSGPRNCIASRFALLELKILLYYLILNFNIEKTDKNPEKIILQPGEFKMIAYGGTWAKFKTRS